MRKLMLSVLASCFLAMPWNSALAVDQPSQVKAALFLPTSKLNKEHFQISYPHLSEEAFEGKWNASLESPLLFFRSYVNTWYSDLSASKNLGVIGPCLGDPHPENFGYLWYGNEDFRYRYNDLDDVGACPVAFDALRYFTALRLSIDSNEIFESVLNHYIDSLTSSENIDEEYVNSEKPRLQKLRDKLAKKNLEGQKIKLGGEVVKASEQEKARVEKTFLREFWAEFSILDIAKVEVKDGGSGGLERFYVLAKSNQAQLELIEFKALTRPASSYGIWATNFAYPREDYLDLAWQGDVPLYFRFAKINRQDFLIRSRIKSDLKLNDLNDEEKLAVLKTQVSLIAKVHSFSLQGDNVFANWLNQSSEVMAQRYKEAYEAAKSVL